LRGGQVQPDRDHRIAMAGAIMGLVAESPTQIPSADIATSFPTFSQILQVLGAPVSTAG
jgi:5-enolpyruvylshikimate-3-phosphate synthase